MEEMVAFGILYLKTADDCDGFWKVLDNLLMLEIDLLDLLALRRLM